MLFKSGGGPLVFCVVFFFFCGGSGFGLLVGSE